MDLNLNKTVVKSKEEEKVVAAEVEEKVVEAVSAAEKGVEKVAAKAAKGEGTFMRSTMTRRTPPRKSPTPMEVEGTQHLADSSRLQVPKETLKGGSTASSVASGPVSRSNSVASSKRARTDSEGDTEPIAQADDLCKMREIGSELRKFLLTDTNKVSKLACMHVLATVSRSKQKETSESEIGQAWEKAGRRKKRKNKKAANKINNDKEIGTGEQSVRENPKERRASRALREKESRESSEEREPRNDIEQERHNAKMNVEDMDPEEREVERLMQNYRIVMSLVPNNSSTITVDDRRQIRAAMHEMKLRTMIMIGVAKELRHKANTTERKMTTTAINTKQRTQGSYSAAVKTGQTEVIAQTEATQQTQKQQHKVSVTAKETGMTPEQVAKVLREKIDPTTHKIAARNYVAMPKMLQKAPSSSKTATDVVSAAEEDSEHVAVISEPPPPSTPCSSDESCEEPKFTTVRRKNMRKIIKKEVDKAKKEINLIEVSEMDNVSEAKEAATVRPGIRKSRNSRDEEANKATTDSEPRSTRETRRSRVPEEYNTPKEIELKKLLTSYKTIMSLIRNTSARITMEENALSVQNCTK
ncbi:hypothetical protein RN001_013700 [Aquatica leii]|uniref:Uncharacterized protein n=1 Tax=Aquatica leii TaxID=1421715 RepID=A0AAN7Q021_9COLE|nr:hypothetical protein RN001_013700 [Aquatica leii]